MMKGETNKCFLCGISIEPVLMDSRDTFSYKCKRCGYVKLTFEATTEISNHYPTSRHLLSGYTRERTEYGRKPLDIMSTDVAKILDSPEIPRNISQKLDKILLLFEHKSNFPGDIIRLELANDYPIGYCKNEEEFGFLLQQLEELGYIRNKSGGSQITGKGWNRLAELKQFKPKGNQCFVAMWFDESLEDVYQNGIRKAIKDAGYIPVRVDLIEHNEKICDRIIAEIRRSKFMVADFTGHRGGVYFEAGFAMGLGIPVIWLCREDHIDKTHFDTRQYNHIVWNSPEDLYKKLLYRIQATIQE